MHAERFVIEVLFLGSGVLIGIIDARTHRIPDTLSLGTLLLVLSLAAIGDKSSLVERLAGMVLGFAAFYGLCRAGLMGLGDVKFSALIGVAIGPAGWMIAVCAASLLGMLCALPQLFTGSITRRTRVAFGPFLTAGSVIQLFAPGLFGFVPATLPLFGGA